MRSSDPLLNRLIPLNFFGGGSPPPPPEPVKPVEIPKVEPVTIPPPPEPVEEKLTFREKHKDEPDVLERHYAAKAEKFKTSNPAKSAKFTEAAAKQKSRAEILLGPTPEIIPATPIPPAPTASSLEPQMKADEELRKQQARRGMSSSIIAGESDRDYVSSATGTGSLLG